MTYIEPEDSTVDDTDAPSDDIKELRKAADRAKSLRSENEQLQRQLLIARSGIDPESPHGKLLMGYSGELTPDLIGELAATSTMAAEPEPGGPDALTDIRRDLAQGAAEPVVPTESTRQAARAAFDQVVAAGESREEAGATMFRRLVQGAMEGDEDVIIKVF